MLEEYGKELMMLGGTIAGFIAALLTVLEKLLDIQTRVHAKKARNAVPQERPSTESSSTIDLFSSKPLRGSSYLLLNETTIIWLAACC